jgi:hypothetical protein
MEFTCIKCEFKFHETKMDTDERMCYDCLEEDDTEPTTADEYNKVQDYGPPYSMANPTGEPVKAHPLGARYTYKKSDTVGDVSESLKIKDYDIATIEHLHDCLLGRKGYSLNHPMLKRSRELTAKLYKIVRSPVGAQPYPEWDYEKGCYILPKKKGIQKDPEC